MLLKFWGTDSHRSSSTVENSFGYPGFFVIPDEFENCSFWDLIKLQSFCKAKDTVNRTKWQPTNWEKTFPNPTPNRGLISNIYKELKKLDLRESNNPIKNGVHS